MDTTGDNYIKFIKSTSERQIFRIFSHLWNLRFYRGIYKIVYIQTAGR